MKIAASCLFVAALLCGCAGEIEPQVRLMTPVDRQRFKDAQAAETEFALINPKCEMKALQAGNTVPPPPAGPGQQNVYIQAAPIYSSGPPALPPVRTMDASSLIAAQQAGQAIGARRALTDATYLACMADAGWIPRQSAPSD